MRVPTLGGRALIWVRPARRGSSLPVPRIVTDLVRERVLPVGVVVGGLRPSWGFVLAVVEGFAATCQRRCSPLWHGLRPPFHDAVQHTTTALASIPLGLLGVATAIPRTRLTAACWTVGSTLAGQLGTCSNSPRSISTALYHSVALPSAQSSGDSVTCPPLILS